MEEQYTNVETGILSLKTAGGILGYQKAKHLLNRCMFGVRHSEINFIKDKTATEAVDYLLTYPTAPLPLPLGVQSTDLEVPVGQTWVNTKYNGTYNSQRLYSYRGWWTGRMMKQSLSLVEKMVLFWHNHFVIETDTVTNINFNYRYNLVLYNHALGNFKTLTEEITSNVGMLTYLDGVRNKVGSPNENYARELLELFTIGKGPLIAPGNYTNYSEYDIQQAAKVLTGWRTNSTTDTSYFVTGEHDKTKKIFSEIFENQFIENKEADEYKHLIALIFQKKEVARFIVRKLYRWFVYYDISASVEQNIIEPLADIFYSSGCEIKTVLKALLTSEHFFDQNYWGCMIKNPLELTVGIYRSLEVDQPADSVPVSQYSFWNTVFSQASLQNLTLGNPPDVAGWTAWYLPPLYSEIWINSATLPQRAAFIKLATETGVTPSGSSTKVVMDPFKAAYLATDPSNLSDLVQTLAGLLLPITPSVEMITGLKEIVNPGLPDTVWATEWNKYVTNPGDATQKKRISDKLLALVKKITSLAEFQLI